MKTRNISIRSLNTPKEFVQNKQDCKLHPPRISLNHLIASVQLILNNWTRYFAQNNLYFVDVLLIITSFIIFPHYFSPLCTTAKSSPSAECRILKHEGDCWPNINSANSDDQTIKGGYRGDLQIEVDVRQEILRSLITSRNDGTTHVHFPQLKIWS